MAKKKGNNTAANLGFEDKLWLAADKMRNNMDAAEYKHVVLGLVFLKYISDAFDEVHAKQGDPTPAEVFGAVRALFYDKRWIGPRGSATTSFNGG